MSRSEGSVIFCDCSPSHVNDKLSWSDSTPIPSKTLKTRCLLSCGYTSEEKHYKKLWEKRYGLPKELPPDHNSAPRFVGLLLCCLTVQLGALLCVLLQAKLATLALNLDSLGFLPLTSNKMTKYKPASLIAIDSSADCLPKTMVGKGKIEAFLRIYYILNSIFSSKTVQPVMSFLLLQRSNWII